MKSFKQKYLLLFILLITQSCNTVNKRVEDYNPSQDGILAYYNFYTEKIPEKSKAAKIADHFLYGFNMYAENEGTYTFGTYVELTQMSGDKKKLRLGCINPNVCENFDLEAAPAGDYKLTGWGYSVYNGYRMKFDYEACGNTILKINPGDKIILPGIVPIAVHEPLLPGMFNIVDMSGFNKKNLPEEYSSLLTKMKKLPSDFLKTSKVIVPSIDNKENFQACVNAKGAPGKLMNE